MKNLTRQDKIMIICILLTFLLFMISLPWNSYTIQEEDYQFLEKIAYTISENKSIELDISEKLPKYEVNFTGDNIYI